MQRAVVPTSYWRMEYLSQIANSTYRPLSDCYVSLHRSEGFGLTIAEAMALGKPAIATAYSGNLEFMTAENSYLCPAPRCEVGPSATLIRPNLTGRSPMWRRQLACCVGFTNTKREAEARGLRAAQEIRALHSLPR